MSEPNEYPNVSVSPDEARDYLNELRESGVTNMFGATPYLQREFDLNDNEAREVLSWWMGQF